MPSHSRQRAIRSSLLVYDLESSASEPYAVLTGDALLVGEVGRPDNTRSRSVAEWRSGGPPTTLAGLYDSLRITLIALPDASLV